MDSLLKLPKLIQMLKTIKLRSRNILEKTGVNSSFTSILR